MKRSLLTIAALLFAVTATSAREIPLPKGALINYHLENTVKDKITGRSLKVYDPGTNSYSEAEKPEYAKDGGLVIDRYYAIDQDLSVKRYPKQSIIVRLRVGKKMKDAGPLWRFMSGGKDWLLGKHLFKIDGDNLGLNAKRSAADKESIDYWMGLPKSDASNCRTYVLTNDNGKCTLTVGNKRCSYYDDTGLELKMDKVLLCPFKKGVVTDVIFYGRCLSEDEVREFTGKDVEYDLTIGDKDPLNESRRSKLMPILFILFNTVFAAVAVLRRRRRREDVVKNRFNGSLLVIIAVIIGAGGYIYIFSGSGSFALNLALIVVSLISYILISFRPVTRQELDEELAQQEDDRRRREELGLKEDSIGDTFRSLCSSLFKSAGKVAGKVAETTGEAIAKSDVTVNTYDSAGNKIKSEKQTDFASFIAPFAGIVLIGALIVGAVLFLLFMAAQLVVLVVSFLPLYKFIANSRKYSSLQ